MWESVMGTICPIAKTSGVALTTRQIATDEPNEDLANHNAA